MKKNLVTFFLIIAVAACNQKDTPAGNVHIKGRIEGLKQGAIIIRNDENTKTIDSIAIKGDENFESHFTLESAEMLHFFLNRGASNNIDNSLDVFVEPGNLSINTTLDRFYADATVKGSENHEKYQEFRKINQRYTDQQLDLTKKRFDAFKNKTDFNEKEAIEESNRIESRRYLAAINFALNNKTLEVAPFIALSEIRMANINLLDTIMSALDPKVKASKYGKMLDAFIKERKALEKKESPKR